MSVFREKVSAPKENVSVFREFYISNNYFLYYTWVGKILHKSPATKGHNKEIKHFTVKGIGNYWF